MTNTGHRMAPVIDALMGNTCLVDSKSHFAAFSVVNIGKFKPKLLMDFIKAIEKSVGIKAMKNFIPMQAGDVPATWANTSLLKVLTGYKPNIGLSTSLQNFVVWCRGYYNV